MSELKEKNGSKTPLFAVIIVVLIAIFAVGFIYGLNSVLAMEGAFPPNIVSVSKTPLPDTRFPTQGDAEEISKEELIKYIGNISDYALSGEAQLTHSRIDRVKEKDGNMLISASAGESLENTLRYLAADVGKSDTVLNNALAGDFCSVSLGFGEDLSKELVAPKLTAADIESFEISYIYYACPSCGADSRDRDNQCFAECPDCGSNYGYQKKYTDEYTVVLNLNIDKKVIKNNFSPLKDNEIVALFEQGAKGNFTIDKLTQSYDALRVELTVERATDKLTRLAYTKELTLKAQLSFEGKWAQFGKSDVSVCASRADEYSLTWPGLSLNLHQLAIAPKGTDNLLATLSCDKPTELEVKWTSSAPETVEVDSEGYLSACKADGGSAVITAQMEYNGKTYSDSCEVFVRNSVESTEMKKNKAKINVGEELCLEVKVKPKNATVKELEWYSEDESIARVDENGVVTGVSQGTVTVYSLSVDGHFKSSCKVEVKGK